MIGTLIEFLDFDLYGPLAADDIMQILAAVVEHPAAVREREGPVQKNTRLKPGTMLTKQHTANRAVILGER